VTAVASQITDSATGIAMASDVVFTFTVNTRLR
jgi:hypothetical protein